MRPSTRLVVAVVMIVYVKAMIYELYRLCHVSRFQATGYTREVLVITRFSA
jgi:hypothetical protein